MFDVLLASNKFAAGVLASDLKATAGREFYDDGYFTAFGADQLPVMQQRLNDSIAAVASMIIGAWEQAGQESTAGPVLNLLFRHALETGKRARTDTDIARGTASVSHAAASK